MPRYIPRISKYSFLVKKSSSGFGLYTTEPIKKNDFVIEYYGRRLNNDQAYEKGGKYLFEVGKRTVIDGTPRYNKARYINHACKPNCEANIVRGKIYIYAKRNIKSGEEISIDYGKEYVDEFIKPYGCKCITCKKGLSK